MQSLRAPVQCCAARHQSFHQIACNNQPLDQQRKHTSMLSFSRQRWHCLPASQNTRCQILRNMPLRSSLLVHAKPGKATEPTGNPAAKKNTSNNDTDQYDEDEGADDDGFYLDDEEAYEGEEGEFFEEYDEGEDDGLLLGLEQDATAPGIDTTGTNWAETALRATRKVLESPALENLELYVFRALPGGKLDIRLDRLDDPYGSPSIDDIEKFSRLLFQELAAELGQEAAGEIALEVSSPGAERTLRIPQDLTRFAGLPLYVEYQDQEGAPLSKVLIMDAFDEAAGMTTWHLADVRANAPGKGRKLSKRQREMAMQIPLASLKFVRVHVDF